MNRFDFFCIFGLFCICLWCIYKLTAAVEALHLRVADLDRDLLALEASLTGDGK